MAGSTPQTLHLVAILATDPDPEHEAARRHQGKVGELAGDNDRVAQRQEVHRRVHRQPVGDREDAGGGEQAVGA